MRNILLFTALALALALPAGVRGEVVSGTVSSASDGEPLIGASVMLKGSKSGTATDIDGNFTIEAPLGATLTVNYVGYNPQQVPVTSTHLDIQLKEQTNALDEVVVVGYGTVKKSDLTSSISTVKAKQIAEHTSGNAMEALQGKVNGVQISSQGGPGSQPKVIIRGVTTVNGSDPLYVVDGMPVGTGVNSINPSDIESMEVLKDASAAAIYGTRGSNGVILITTKRGTEGPTHVDFQATVGWQHIDKPHMAGAREYERVIKASYTNDGAVARWNSPHNDYTDDMGTDWWDETINSTALVQNYQLGIRGGSAKYSYSIGIGYFRNNSQTDVGYWDKLSLNLNTEYRFNKYVHAGLQIAPHTQSWRNTVTNFSSVVEMDPTTPVFKPQEEWTDNAYDRYQRSYNNECWNPAGALARPSGYSRSYQVLLNPYAQVMPVEGLTIKTQFGAIVTATRADAYNPQYKIDALEQNQTNSVSRNMQLDCDWNWVNTVNYMHTFNRVHNINLMGGFTMERFCASNAGAYRENIPSDVEELREVNAGTAADAASGATSYNTLLSYLGRVMYNFDQRYYITATVRVDGSSRFPKGKKYGTFPSVSGAWRISQEPFMKDVDWLNNLKLRAGWGKVGNQNIANTSSLTLMGQVDYVFGMNPQRYSGTWVSQVGNRNLKWETVEDYDLGLDVSLLNSRLDVTFDVYRKKSHDMLYNKQNLLLLGYPNWNSQVTMNVGKMQATGWELSLAWRDRIRDFSYSVGVNLSGVRNKAVKLSGDGPVLDNSWNSDNISRTEDGGLIGRFYGYRTDGLFQSQTEVNSYTNEHGDPIQPNAKPGDIRFVDRDHNGKLDENDKEYIGNPYPDLMMGVNLGCEWRGIDFTANFYGTFGNDIYNTTLTQYSGKQGSNVRWGAYNEAWHGTGTSTWIPRISAADANLNYTRVSDFFVEDGSYFRCKLMQIGYTLPKHWLGGTNLRVSFSVQNLFTITHYKGFDPETPARSGNVLSTGVDKIGYPNPRTFLFGVNYNF